MQRLLVAVLLVVLPISARAAQPSACPLERLVGWVRTIDGDRQAVQLLRDGKTLPVTPDACLVYGDRVSAGIGATVIIDTANGPRRIGATSNPDWTAPQPSGAAVSPDLSAVFADLFNMLTGRAQFRNLVAVAGSSRDRTDRADCVPPQDTSPRVQPLARLRATDQRIGADLRTLLVAWTPSDMPHAIHAQLLSQDGWTLYSNAETCSGSSLTISAPPVAMLPGRRLSLVLADDRGPFLRYELHVVEPAQLPQPPVSPREAWLLGAWRIAAGPADTRLDAIARLHLAPADSFGATIILNAILTDTPF